MVSLGKYLQFFSGFVILLTEQHQKFENFPSLFQKSIMTLFRTILFIFYGNQTLQTHGQPSEFDKVFKRTS